MDKAFDKLLDADYHDEQMGELDGDDDCVGGFIEPSDRRLKELANEKRADPAYDEMVRFSYHIVVYLSIVMLRFYQLLFFSRFI